ncbi:MAG: hypothetical protein ABIF77_02530 [bacterium]
MAGAAKKWLLGCGIGCGALILIPILLGVGSVFFMRSAVSELEDAVVVREELEERYGMVEDYVPEGDGAIPADRLRLFLTVRDSLAAVRTGLAETFVTLEQGGDAFEHEAEGVWEKIKLGMRLGKTGLGMVPQLGDFFLTRDRVLVAVEMGVGEYTYIYCLAYYCWLGNPVDDSHESSHFEVRSSESGGGIITINESSSERRSRQRQARRLSAQLRTMLQNQLAALPEVDEPGADAWREELAAEVERLRRNPHGLPWAEGLPAAILASFEPFERDLSTSYSAATNPFELGRIHKDGWSFTAE